jgi:hypothetical protein
MKLENAYSDNQIVVQACPKDSNKFKSARGSKFRGISKNGKKWQVSVFLTSGDVHGQYEKEILWSHSERNESRQDLRQIRNILQRTQSQNQLYIY